MNSALRSRLLILCLSIAVATVSVFSQETAKKAPPEKCSGEGGRYLRGRIRGDRAANDQV